MIYIRIGAATSGNSGSINLQFGLVSTQDPMFATDNPDGAQVFSMSFDNTIVDLGTNSVCQFGFTTGVTDGGCGSCRYTSNNLVGTPIQLVTLVPVRTNNGFPGQPAPVCPNTNNGRPLT
jgi:hypothetical protein